LLELLTRSESGDPGAGSALRELITVNHSRFFREAAHWPILAEHLRIRQRSPGKKLRLWSAACAGGQEAWSIAMLASELAEDTQGKDLDWQVLATDIDGRALSGARAGRYTAQELTGLTAAQRAQHLDEAGTTTGWAVNDRLRERVAFRRFDLASPQWEPIPEAPFDAIFLCNVLIYFTPDVQARVLAQAAQQLRPDGILFTSRTEGNLDGAAPALRACGDCTYILARKADSIRSRS
jgi:chemotaxis protein methyltransferase CheR